MISSEAKRKRAGVARGICVLSVTVLFALSACSEDLAFDEPEPEYVPPRESGWEGPEVTDLEALTGSFSYNSGRTYSDYRLRGSAVGAVLAAGLYDEATASFRLVTRLYTPHADGGSGWAVPGDHFRMPSEFTGATSHMVPSVNSAGNVLVFAGNTSTAASLLFNGTSWIGTTLGSDAVVSNISASGLHQRHVGFRSEFVWSSATTGYLLTLNSSYTPFVKTYSTTGGWTNAVQPGGLPTSTMVALAWDGYGAVLVWDQHSGVTRIRAVWDYNNPTFSSPVDISSGDASEVYGVDVAADTSGNALAIFNQALTGAGDCSNATDPATVGGECQVRVYSNAKSIVGTWSGATRVDTFWNETSTQIRDPSGAARNEFAVPQVVYLGSGKFQAVFAVTDNVARKTGLYARYYDVATGWDAGYETIHEASQSGDDEHYRFHHAFDLVTDGAGKSLLVTNYVTGDFPVADEREWGVKVFSYDGSNWTEEVTVGGAYSCWQTDCETEILRPSAHLFPGGEKVVVYAGADLANPNKLRLYTSYYY